MGIAYPSRGVRNWGRAVAVAAGAAVSAGVIGVVGMPTARADSGSLATDIGLLTSAQTDASDAFAALGVGGGSLSTELGALTDQFETIQTALLSADNSFSAGVGELLFNGSDQQLAQSAETFLSAAEAYAAEPTSTTDVFAAFSAGLGYEGSLLFGAGPANVVGLLIDRLAGFDLSGVGSTADVSSGADSAATLASAVTTPADLLSDATTHYTDASQLLSEIPSSSLGEYAAAVGPLEEINGPFVQSIANLGAAETALSGYDNGVLAELLNPVFTSVNQSWDNFSEFTLAGTQAFAETTGTSSTTDVTASLLTLAYGDLATLGTFAQSGFIDLGANVLTGGDFLSFPDLVASVDPVSAVDPSLFADLLSSIGL